MNTIDAKLAAAIDEFRTETESVCEWIQLDAKVVSVSLIEANKLDQAHRMIAIGLAGGEGRSLKFKLVEGKWNLVSQGRWIA